MAKRLPPRIEPHQESGVFYIIYTANGRSQRKSLRTDNLFEAEARFAGWLEQHQKDALVETDPLVGDCLDWWFEQWIEGRMKSENRYPAAINNLKAYYGNKTVSEIVRQDSINYTRIRKEGRIGRCPAANSTVLYELQKLRACFRFMVERIEPKERRLSWDIMPYVETPEPSPPRNRVLDTSEVNTLREFCTDLVWNGAGRKPSNRLSKIGRFVMIAMETAQRKSAILNLKWSQVDLEMGIITFLPEGQAQTSKRRPPLPISSRLRPILERAYQERISEYVCDSPTDVHDMVKSVGTKLDIPGLSSHVFRHTWATRAVMAGAKISKVAMFLGDSEETVKKNYLHLSPDYLRDIVDQA